MRTPPVGPGGHQPKPVGKQTFPNASRTRSITPKLAKPALKHCGGYTKCMTANRSIPLATGETSSPKALRSTAKRTSKAAVSALKGLKPVSSRLNGKSAYTP